MGNFKKLIELLPDQRIEKLKAMDIDTQYRFDIFYIYFKFLKYQINLDKLELFIKYLVEEYEEEAKKN